MVLGFRQQHGPVLPEASYPDWEAISQQTDSPFSAVIGSQLSSDALTLNGKSYSISTNYVTATISRPLGLRPTLGPFPSFRRKKYRALTDHLLGIHFGSPASAQFRIVGSKVLVDGRPFTIIGVAPRGFHGLVSILDYEHSSYAMKAALDDGAEL